MVNHLLIQTSYCPIAIGAHNLIQFCAWILLRWIKQTMHFNSTSPQMYFAGLTAKKKKKKKKRQQVCFGHKTQNCVCCKKKKKSFKTYPFPNRHKHPKWKKRVSVLNPNMLLRIFLFIFHFDCLRYRYRLVWSFLVTFSHSFSTNKNCMVFFSIHKYIFNGILKFQMSLEMFNKFICE